MAAESHYEVYARPVLTGLREFFEKIAALHASPNSTTDQLAKLLENISTLPSAPFGPGWTIVGRGYSSEKGGALRIVLRVPALSDSSKAKPVWGEVRINADLQTLGGKLLRRSSRTIPFDSGGSGKYILTISKSSLWDNNQTVRDDNAVRVVLEVTSALATGISHVIEDSKVRLIFEELTAGTNLQDVKFILYPYCRYGFGTIAVESSRVIELYANHVMLMARSDYFKTLLNQESGFSESRHVPMDEDAAVPPSSGYDYESDSDIDDEDDEEEEDGEMGDNSDSDNSKSGEVYPSKIEPEIDKSEEPPKVPSIAEHVMDSTTVEQDQGPAETPETEISVGKTGAAIPIPDFSHKTWNAMLQYLFTGHVRFAPLRRRRESIDIVGSPASSPKSLYRLADKIGLIELKSLALKNLEEQLKNAIIINELFSKFTSRYPEIREAELRYTLAHWTTLRGSKEIETKITEIASGEHPHAAETLKLLMVRMVAP